MAGLQTIIDNCNGLQIDRRKSVGQQFTRNSIPRVSVTPTRNPWQFIVDMPSSFRYSAARALIEEIDRLEKHYYDSLKLLKLYEKSEERKLKPSSTHTDSRFRK